VGDNDVSVLLGYGNGSFATQIVYSTGSFPYSVAVGDFNNDTRLDIVVANELSSVVSVLLGYTNEVFVNQLMLIVGSGSRPRSFAIGDVNNDNRMDIVVVNSGTDNIGIFLGYGNLSFASPTIYSIDSSSSPCAVAAGDFNNDTYLDIVVANCGSNNVGIFLGFGNGSFVNQATYLTGSHPCSVAVGDFNNDFILDIIVANYDDSSVVLLLGHRDSTFGNMVSIQLKYGSYPFSVLVGDFNNDRKLDFAVANNGTDSLQIFLQTC
jgi:hypothetical protein